MHFLTSLLFSLLIYFGLSGVVIAGVEQKEAKWRLMTYVIPDGFGLQRLDAFSGDDVLTGKKGPVGKTSFCPPSVRAWLTRESKEKLSEKVIEISDEIRKVEICPSSARLFLDVNRRRLYLFVNEEGSSIAKAILTRLVSYRKQNWKMKIELLVSKSDEAIKLAESLIKLETLNLPGESSVCEGKNGNVTLKVETSFQLGNSTVIGDRREEARIYFQHGKKELSMDWSSRVCKKSEMFFAGRSPDGKQQYYIKVSRPLFSKIPCFKPVSEECPKASDRDASGEVLKPIEYTKIIADVIKIDKLTDTEVKRQSYAVAIDLGREVVQKKGEGNRFSSKALKRGGMISSSLKLAYLDGNIRGEIVSRLFFTGSEKQQLLQETRTFKYVVKYHAE